MGFFIVSPVQRETNQSPYSTLPVLSQVKCVPQPVHPQVDIHNDLSGPEGVLTPFVTAITAPATRALLHFCIGLTPTTRNRGHGATEGDTAMAWLVLAASAPAIMCVLCAAFLIYQQRPAWGWFIGLAIGAQFAALVLILNLRAWA
jgi:hypothetical protein